MGSANRSSLDGENAGCDIKLFQSFSMRFEYDLVFTRDAFDPSNTAILDALTRTEPDKRHRVLFVVDDGVARAWPHLPAEVSRYAAHHASAIELVAPCAFVAGGERCKSDPAVLQSLLALFEQHRMDRHSFVVAVGGGALLDACGYAAAIAHRGLRHVRMPTTTLSQADSGVGVKNGINAFGKKNFLGTFAPPFAVISDERFLSTLSDRDTISGFAEAVKVGLLKDASFFRWICDHAAELACRAPAELRRLVRRCAALHLAHIAKSGDPFELGSSRPLDYGHWAAHKLEAMTQHELRHGEAVAIGMAIDALYAAELGIAPPHFANEVLDVLERLGFILWHDALDVWDDDGTPVVIAGLDEFREHLGGDLTLPLVTSPGQVVEVHDVDERRLSIAIARLRGRLVTTALPEPGLVDRPSYPAPARL